MTILYIEIRWNFVSYAFLCWFDSPIVMLSLCSTWFPRHIVNCHTWSQPYIFLYFSGEIDTVLSHRLTKINSSESKSSHIHQQHQDNVSGILSTDTESSTSKPNQVKKKLAHSRYKLYLSIDRFCVYFQSVLMAHSMHEDWSVIGKSWRETLHGDEQKLCHHSHLTAMWALYLLPLTRRKHENMSRFPKCILTNGSGAKRGTVLFVQMPYRVWIRVYCNMFCCRWELFYCTACRLYHCTLRRRSACAWPKFQTHFWSNLATMRSIIVELRSASPVSNARPFN